MDGGTRAHDVLIAELHHQELRLLRTLAKDSWEPLLATTLTIQQWKVLLLVHLEGSLGGHDLAERLGVTAPTVSGVVDRLAERGLVARLADPQDRRVRRVRLTAAGERLVEDLLTAGRTRRAALLHRLDLATLAGLVAGMTALAEAAESTGCTARDPSACQRSS